MAYQTPIDGGGTVVVTRDRGFIGGGCKLGFYVDGKLAGIFETGETARFHVPAGEHDFGVGTPSGIGFCFATTPNEPRELSARVAPGQTRYYRLVVRPGDGMGIESTSQR